MREFDENAVNYSVTMENAVAFSGQSHDFFVQKKVDLIAELAGHELGDLASASVLDVGCGVGLVDRILIDRVRSLHGIDVSRESIDEARENVSSVHFQHFDGKRFPFADDTFDLVFASGVVHHVPPAERPDFMMELARVIRTGGLGAIIEHNTLNPLTRYVVSRCPLDKNAILLRRGQCEDLLLGAGLEITESRYFLFLPFKGEGVNLLERLLAGLPLGAQYLVAGKKA